MRSVRWLAAAFTLAFASTFGPALAAPVRAVAIRSTFRFSAIDGTVHGRADLLSAKASVFLFLSHNCPVANAYTPRILRFVKAYAPKGVKTYAIYADSLETVADVREDAKGRGYTFFPVIKDVRNNVTDVMGATGMPEAVVVDGRGVIRYRGRIDDNAVTTRVIRHDLTDVVDALLAGKAPPETHTATFGCTLRRDDGVSDVNGVPTYAADVAPILRARCEGCHRPGEIGPFPLQTYRQAAAWAKDIKTYTGNGQMPPWKPIAGYGEFRDEASHSLSDHDRALLASWVDGGAPLGDVSKLPPAAKFVTGWRLGTPDLTLGPDRPFHVAAEGDDIYRNFVVRTNFPRDVFLNACEVRPGNRAVVHHILVYVDAKRLSDGYEGHDRDGQPGYSGPTNVRTEQLIGGWGPGGEPRRLPVGVAVRIPKGANLVMQVHYHRNGKPAIDLSRIGLHFARYVVEKQVYTPIAYNADFRIPVGATHYEVRAEMPVTTDMHLIAVAPHMHMLGREMRVWAELPNGEERPLIWIKDWDFAWQNTYFLKTPLALPTGSKVMLVAYFDNSGSNPRNPNRTQLRDVTWGEQTTDEMAIAFLAATVDSERLNVKPVPPRELLATAAASH